MTSDEMRYFFKLFPMNIPVRGTGGALAAMESRVLRGRVSPRSKDKLFFKLFLLFSKDGGEIRRCVPAKL